jgi:hypothetical protein
MFYSLSVDHRTENERLPTELGWSIPSTMISLDDLHNFSHEIINATSFSALEKKELM